MESGDTHNSGHGPAGISPAAPIRLLVPPDAEGVRLDVFLSRAIPTAATRGVIQRMIRGGGVTIAGKHIVKPSTILHKGHEIVIAAGALANERRLPVSVAELPPLKILHEDRNLIVVDKPAGAPVHPGAKTEPSLADTLVSRYPGLRDVGEDPRRPGPPAALHAAMRAGIVHRLDKETSGVLLVARTQAMYEHVKQQFHQRRVRKTYLALVHGLVPESEGVVKLPLVRSKRNPLRRTVARHGEGKEAETSFEVLERFHEHTLLAVYPRTGRMHQIRVHLAHLGFPVAGDSLYGRKSRHRTPPGLQRQFLHAQTITVTYPSGAKRTFESPLPDDLVLVLDRLRASARGPSEKPVTYRWRTPRSAP